MTVFELLNSETSYAIVLSLGHSVWQISVVAVVAAGLAARRSPGARHLIFVGAMLASVCCLPINYLVQTGDQESPGQPAVSTESANPWEGFPGADARPAAGEGFLPGDDMAESRGLPVEGPVDASASSLSGSWNRVLNSLSEYRFLRSASSWIVVLYVLGVLCMALRLVIGLTSTQRLRRNSIPVENQTVSRVLDRATRELGLRVAPLVASCIHVSAPIVVGIVRPAILLPAAFLTEMTPQQVESLLLHEIAHIRRRDHVFNLLQRFAEAVLFFHPAIWWLSRKVSIERENCCDDFAVRWGSEPCDYAESLVKASEMRLRLRQTALIRSMALSAVDSDAAGLRQRVSRILGLPSHEPSAAMRWQSVVLLFAAGVLGFVLSNDGVADGPTNDAVTALDPTAESASRPEDEPMPKFSFSRLTVEKDSMMADANDTLVILQDGTCEFRNDHGPQLTTRYKLSAREISRFEQLLEKVDYLREGLPAGLDPEAPLVRNLVGLAESSRETDPDSLTSHLYLAQLRLMASGSNAGVPTDQTWFKVRMERDDETIHFSRYDAEEMKPAIRKVLNFLEQIRAQEVLLRGLTAGDQASSILMFMNLRLDQKLGRRKGIHASSDAMPLSYRRISPVLEDLAGGSDEELASRAKLTVRLLQQLPNPDSADGRPAITLKDNRGELATFNSLSVTVRNASDVFSVLHVDPDGWLRFLVLESAEEEGEAKRVHDHRARLSRRELVQLDQLLIAADYLRDPDEAIGDESGNTTEWYDMRVWYESTSHPAICCKQSSGQYLRLFEFLKPIIQKHHNAAGL